MFTNETYYRIIVNRNYNNTDVKDMNENSRFWLKLEYMQHKSVMQCSFFMQIWKIRINFKLVFQLTPLLFFVICSHILLQAVY